MTSPRRGGHTDATQEAGEPPGCCPRVPAVPVHKATGGTGVSQELFTVLSLAAGTGCLITLFVAAHLSWLEKQRRRAWRRDRAEITSPRVDSVERESACRRAEATA